MSEVFLGGTQLKYGILGQKSSLVCGLKKVDWSRNYSLHVIIGEMWPSII